MRALCSTPRYFEMLNATVEDWFEADIGAGFPTMIDTLDCASPLGTIETKFIVACRLGELLTFSLNVQAAGEKTVTLLIETYCQDELRAVSKLTLVCVHRDISGARAWPPAIREQFDSITKGAKAHA